MHMIAHDEQGDNPGQEKRGLDSVLYNLWPLRTPRVAY